MERRRRVNQHGTTESGVATVERDRLKGWNSKSPSFPSRSWLFRWLGLIPFSAAWNTLKDDGILEKGLEDINAGQTHRARLLAQSFPVHTPAPPSLPPASSALEEAQRFHLGATGRGRSNLRGGARGGRGGGAAGSNPERHAHRRFVHSQSYSPIAHMVRVPITVEGPSLPRHLTPKPRVLLPSVTGRPAAPDSLKENAKPLRARVVTGSSAADASRTLRRK